MKAKYIAILAGILSVMACSIREESFDEPSTGVVSFRAVNGDVQDTKTVLQSDGNLLWSAKDKIDIFVGAQSFEFTGTNTSAVSEATFTGSLDGVDWSSGKEYWAVYPHSSNNSSDGSSITVCLTAEQEACAGSFANNLFISIAKSQDYDLTFFNVCGGIKFSVTEAGVESVTFKGNNGEAIAGTAKVTFDQNGKPIVHEVTNPLSEVTLSAPAGTTLEVGKWYYIVCFPTVLQNGYTMTLNKAFGSVAVKKGDTTVTIKRSTWGRLTEMDKVLEYSVPNNEIWYYTKDGEPTTHIYVGGTSFGAKVLSNTYENGHGVIKFDGEINTLPEWAFGYPSDWDGASCNYYELNDVTKIVVPSSVKSIQQSAIVNLQSLETLCLPEGVEVIDSYAIAYCEKLNNIIIPSTVNTIGINFYNCPSLTSLSVEAGNAVYDSRGNCNAIIETESNTLLIGSNNCIIPDSVRIIGDSAFRGRSFKTISIPSSVTEIGYGAFQDNKQLESIILPDNVKKIYPNAFSYCSSLKTVSFPDGLETIGAGSFSSCESLISIVLPSSLLSIGNSAFSFCTGLQKITCWANNPPQIGSSPFYNTGSCPIYVPEESVNSYKSSWSSYSSRINAITQPNNEIWYKTSDKKAVSIYSYHNFGSPLVSNTYEGGMGIIKCESDIIKIPSVFWNESVTDVFLPNAIEEIDAYAFENSSISSIRIPDSVTQMGPGAFGYCQNLRRFYGKYASEDGKMLITTDYMGRKELYAYADPDAKEIVISKDGIDVEYVGMYAFAGHNMETLYCTVECDWAAFQNCKAKNITLAGVAANAINNWDTYFPCIENLTILGSDDPYTWQMVNLNGLGWPRHLKSITLPAETTIQADYGPTASVLPMGCKIYGPNASSDHACWIVNGDLQLWALPSDTHFYRLPSNVTKVSACIDLLVEEEGGYLQYIWDWPDENSTSFTTSSGIIIPSTVNEIYSVWIFRMPVIFESATPPSISHNYNFHEGRKAYVLVPYGARSTYKTAWNSYFEEPENEWEQWNKNQLFLFDYSTLPSANDTYFYGYAY